MYWHTRSDSRSEEEVRKTLGEVDRSVFIGQGGHDGENGSANVAGPVWMNCIGALKYFLAHLINRLRQLVVPAR